MSNVLDNYGYRQTSLSRRFVRVHVTMQIFVARLPLFSETVAARSFIFAYKDTTSLSTRDRAENAVRRTVGRNPKHRDGLEVMRVPFVRVRSAGSFTPLSERVSHVCAELSGVAFIN